MFEKGEDRRTHCCDRVSIRNILLKVQPKPLL